MNGLALRISNAGGKKSKTSHNFMKLNVSKLFPDELMSSHELFRTFCEANTADEHLSALKPILEAEALVHATEGTCNIQSIQFLVKIFFNTEAKHPVKCFLVRHITKNSFIQLQFSEVLSQEIKSVISSKPPTYKEYVDVLTKTFACIENFPAGAVAVKTVELDLAKYLDDCLQCCVKSLGSDENLSPTEKNEIFNLAHLALRLYLYIVQKVSPENVEDLTSMFTSLRTSIKELLFDVDAPMDTKTVCGMVYLNMHILERGPDAWVDMLLGDPKEECTELLEHEPSKLALLSAVATVTSMNQLQTTIIDDESSLLVLCKKILWIGEKDSSESVMILGVIRSLVQITKNLNKLADTSVGLTLVANLLNFVWAHLEHYMDSVRHITAQLLMNIVKYCSLLDKEGDPEVLTALFDALTTYLDHNRKSYFVSLTSLVAELGAARVLCRLPNAVCDVINALSLQHVQASATTTLETFLQKHVKETDTKTINEEWVEPILQHVKTSSLDSSVLNVLENLLTRAVQLDSEIIHYILPHIKKSATDLKCVLMLLRVARKSGVTSNMAANNADEWKWKGLISYQVLRRAAVDAVEETRILCLSLIVESPKTTEVFTRGELNFILKYLKYNINAQSPNFRQLTLSLMKKFVKRLGDSYRAFIKQENVTENYYKEFLETLRSLCFDSLIPGANYSRRFVALQILIWCEHVNLDGFERIWTEDYAEKLLYHLEDSYENNKAFALEILSKCPSALLKGKKYSISLELEDILQQASSLKPTDCISAAYKLDLLRTKLPEKIVGDVTCNETVSERVTYTLLERLHNTLLVELAECERSVVSAAVHAPMYGVLHCMLHLMTKVDVDAISSDKQWSSLISSIIKSCYRVNAGVGCVVNNSSPEGHLPCDMGAVSAQEYHGLRLDDGRPVTAQMVLLCAWRSVKEVSLLLGEISSRFSIAGEGSEEGTLTAEQMILMGEHFTKLLAETKHRGAFEQAYVGFTKLLARLWRCRTTTLHSLPRTWLTELMQAIESGDKRDTLSTTRRGAGLPFMIQALVTTELQVQGNPKCFHQCMSTLLRLARSPPPGVQQSETAIETRVHSINILRALFRNSALDESVAAYVGEGLRVAIEGFEGKTWMERNSSTLLFSALMVRVFGVQRSKDSDNLCTRNKMTGRIFFLRYPLLYDFMLDKLKEVGDEDGYNAHILRPALYPTLLLLARLYPSSLEGTVSNLKVSAYRTRVCAIARSPARAARALAARAAVPLLPPELYIQNLESLTSCISDKHIKRNYCHGILLQLTRFLSSKPEHVDTEISYHSLQLYSSDEQSSHNITKNIRNTYWILEQATGDKPCYMIADEYVKMVNLMVWKLPTLIEKDISESIQNCLDKLIFTQNKSQIYAGKDVCLANALYLYFILIIQRNEIVKIYDLMYKALSHSSYEVVLSTLNFFLIVNEDFEIENSFEEHLDFILNKDGPKEYSRGSEIAEQTHEYTQLLCEVFRSSNYPECQRKALKVLSLQKNTGKNVVSVKMKKRGVKLTDEIVINTLIECVNTEKDCVAPIYLSILSGYISGVLEKSAVKPNLMLEVIRLMFACSGADSEPEARSVVVGFIENHLEELFMMGLDGLSKEAKFEFKATVYAILVTLLEDNDSSLRQRTSNVILKLQDIFPNAYSKPMFRGTSVPNVGSETRSGFANINFRGYETNLSSEFRGFDSELVEQNHRSDSNFNSYDCDESSKLMPSRSAELLRDMIANNEEQNIAIFVTLALLDFRSEVCMNDEINDECRVFDQNERYNIHLEETVWTKEVSRQINHIANQTQTRSLDLVEAVLQNSVLRKPIAKLCNNNLVYFEVMVNNDVIQDISQINPKVELFVKNLMN